MISIFKQRKPRGYHHQPIYSDERRERLKAMEKQVRADLGLSTAKETKGTDSPSASRPIRFRREMKSTIGLLGNMPTLIMVILLAALLLLMFYLVQS